MGGADSARLKSAPAMTVVAFDTVLFDASLSPNAELTVDPTVVVPCAFNLRRMVNVPCTVNARFGCEQVMIPGPFTPTVIPVHKAPVPTVNPLYVVFAGTVIV